MARHDAFPSQPTITRGVSWTGCLSIDFQPVVATTVVQRIEGVDEPELVSFRPPLQDRLLKPLNDEPVELKAASHRVAEHIDTAQRLKGGPEWNAVGVRHGKARWRRGSAICLGEEVTA